ncbi:ras GEF [Byssothecium circinans]|uniref:Ras GEF n=1 Tax=Byssothecium circinans TaxID=147558 RepID=A0A6A5UFP7_9PLEO|nr:ras GEF [Byssothecium circinans]
MPPRRESAAQASAGSAGLRPPNLKNRAYSAPMIPKPQGRGDDDAAADADDDALAHHGEAGDDEEIAGDEFFQRYHFPQLAETDEASSSSADSSSDTEGPMSPTHIKMRMSGLSDSLPSPRSPVPSVASGNSDSASSMQDLNIAVLGTCGTGKSTFIRRALNLPDTGSSSVCTRKMTIDGGYYIVRFVEMGFDDVQIGNSNTIRWPDKIDGLDAPRIDGAVTMYDVTNKHSLKLVPEILHVLSKSGLPFILVAAKCDQHPREVDPAIIEEKAKKFPGDVNAFQTSAEQPETQRGCLSVITRAVIASKRPRSQASMARRRANSSAVRSSITKDPWGRKHERASSEFSARYRPHSSENPSSQRYKPGETNKTFFNFEEESPAQDSNESDGDVSDGGEAPSDENGYTFDQLVDRLLTQPLSKNDSRYVSIFLALYRKFATPGQLLDAILKRFESFKRRQLPPMIRISEQMRALAVLQQWVSCYPGDFAFATTRKTVRKFASSLSTNREFAAAAKEILYDLEVVSEDDDTDWACSDRQRLQHDSLTNFHTVLDEDSEDDDFTRALGSMSMSSSERLSIARSSMTGASRTTQSSAGSMSSTQTLLHWVERNEKQAQSLVPNPIKALSKVQWHQIMNESEQAIARELTRIDWIMFSSIRPRDFVRHVSATPEERKKFKSLENVARMSEHFNHVAFLVANYILLRDKSRHRALMMEKWMKVARELRKINNYNTLGAVIAGIKNTSVYRLKETASLLPQQVGHDFTRLEMLMNTTKGSAAYRLAWENSSSERIPFIPLHRGDLVSAAEGNSTFIGDKSRSFEPSGPHPGTSVFPGGASNRNSREAPPGGVTGKERINWRKFDIMGQVVVTLQRAQGTPYPNWHKNEEIRNLVLDVKICKDEDDLYDRSVQLEAAASGEKKRLFNWIRERQF